jgi:hypothetical protein
MHYSRIINIARTTGIKFFLLPGLASLAPNHPKQLPFKMPDNSSSKDQPSNLASTIAMAF